MTKINGSRPSNNGVSFWFCAGLLIILLISILSRDITRPFYGLHSWAQASSAWAARVHVKYGLGYTKAMSTWAVGNPPTQIPKRYMDHPQLGALVNAATMAILGIHDWSLRITGIIASLACFLIFLKILRGLMDDKTALLAGLLYALFPLTGYFGAGHWNTLASFSAIWFYLVLIGSLKNAPPPSGIHRFGLAMSLFITLQFGWTGFFYALSIGVHYVARCIFRKQLPDKGLLAILIFAPLLSLALIFTVMAAGYEWDIQKIVALYKWRSAKGEMPQFLWGAWFARFWEHALTNFTLPILITAIIYLTLGQLFVFMETKPNTKYKRRPRQFPQFWLFFITPLSQLLILRGCLWAHQTWERPLAPFIAISTALGVMLLADILKKIHRRLSVASIVILVGVFTICCVAGTNYYHSIRWQAPAKISMLKMLNQRIPPDKTLLSFEGFIVNQHSSKGGFYRPEVAWYLDREIVQATTLKQIQEYSKTGQYPYYLIPMVDQLTPLINQLNTVYQYQYVAGEPGEQTKDGKFLKAGMTSYMIFNLNSKTSD